MTLTFETSQKKLKMGTVDLPEIQASYPLLFNQILILFLYVARLIKAGLCHEGLDLDSINGMHKARKCCMHLVSIELVTFK